MKKVVKKFNPIVLIVCLIIVLAVGYLGSIFTNTGTWYESIKPTIAPPNYVFGIVWTILYLMIALAMYLTWQGSTKNEKKKIILFYGLNLFLNFFWSVTYFGLKNPLFGMLVIILIWISILQLLVFNWRRQKLAFYLLIPYFLWVSFAAVLNAITI